MATKTKQRWQFPAVANGIFIMMTLMISSVHAQVPMPAFPQKPVVPQLVLASGWDSPMQGGTQTMDDLSKLFGTLATASTNVAADPSIIVYGNVPYLTPLKQAVQMLNVTTSMLSKNPVACPGLPRDSLYYYSVDGRFDGEFNRMYLVVDRADQLVSVQLVNEHPTGVIRDSQDQGYHCYDFVLSRVKAMSKMRIQHLVHLQSQTNINPRPVYGQPIPRLNRTNADWKVLQVDSMLGESDPHKQISYTFTALEKSRWYVPRPLVELILTCVQKAPH